MDHTTHNQIVSFIWGIADDVLRDVYTRGKYRDVILPMTVIRRLDVLLEPTKEAVLKMNKHLDESGIINKEAALRNASGNAFYNTSQFTLKSLLNSPQQLKANFTAYLDGFSANVQEIIDKFKFRNQLDTLAEADALGYLIQKFIDPNINLSHLPVYNADGSVRLPALDNHSMGTVFEELIRKFNEENNEEAGEHFTPRDVVRLMANMIFLPIADQIESGTYLVYDGACGTGGMLTVAEETLGQLAEQHGKDVSIHLYGQEINPEIYAITKSDLLLKGEGEEAENMSFGSTLSNDGFPGREFDFMLSNPPYGKSWKADLERLCGGVKKDMQDPRFVTEHNGDSEYSMVTRSSDGQMMFLVNMLSKMKQKTKLGSRIAEVHNGSALFTGDAGQGESNIRRWIIENDWLEAIIALPTNMFYNTGIATYIWVLTNRKADHRKGKVQLIDASQWFSKLRKNLGQKNCEFTDEHIKLITDAFAAFEETEQSKIFPNEAFGFWKITVERPLRLASKFTRKAVDTLRFASGDEDIRRQIHSQFGAPVFESFYSVKKQVEAWLKEQDLSLTDKQRKSLLSADTWERDHRLATIGRRLLERFGDRLFEDHNEFLKLLEGALSEMGVKLTATEKKAIIGAVSWRNPDSPPVVKKRHRDGTVEYEPDSELRDTEQIPLLYEGGIQAYFNAEVLPYVTDAWYEPGKEKIGYEIPFTRHFYKYKPLRELSEIIKDIKALEREAEGLLAEITGEE